MSATEEVSERKVEVTETRDVAADGTVTEKRVETVVEVRSSGHDILDEEEMSTEIHEKLSGSSDAKTESDRDKANCVKAVIEVHAVSYDNANNGQIQKVSAEETRQDSQIPANGSEGSMECSGITEVHSDWSRTAEVKENQAVSGSDGEQKQEEVVLNIQKVLEVELPAVKEETGAAASKNSEENSGSPSALDKPIVVSEARSVLETKEESPVTKTTIPSTDYIPDTVKDQMNENVVVNSSSIDATEHRDKDTSRNSTDSLQQAHALPGSPSQLSKEQLGAEELEHKAQPNCQVSVIVSAASDHSSDIQESTASEKESPVKEVPPESLSESSPKTSDAGETTPAPATSQHPAHDTTLQENRQTAQTTTAVQAASAPPPKPPHTLSNDGMSLGSVTIRTTTTSAPPTPPTRRKSTMPGETPQPSPTLRRPPSVASSRVGTMNYNIQRGRLSFPTLPRNARPPTREFLLPRIPTQLIGFYAKNGIRIE
ncbi:hypothetical protein ANCCEY_11571 [Ancylostoma ceylanicum]|uniref:Uncharacterized protein n=1 Tax=Ancylostoma ceylanicum TaxID=53326 RepID=A0A0D6LBV5_9BILA|nr:hypothetical protein ANCCEY_11571 [Ancylostoma ceylanicum]